MSESHARKLKELFADNVLFKGFDDSHYEQLDHLVCESRAANAEEYLIHEGDSADEMFVIEEGHVEILVKEADSDRTHAIATLGPGECLGEVALLDAGLRSASARVIDRVKVSVIKIADLELLADQQPSITTLMKLNLAERMARRMRTTNEGTVRSLQDMLEESEKRIEMGKFMSRVLIGTCLYTFALGAIKGFSHLVADTTFITVPILLAFAVGLFINIKTSIYPASDYGFNTRNWQSALKEALLFSIPVLVLAVLVKWVLTHTLPSMEGMDIFDFYRSKNTSLELTIVAFLAYALFAPVQEMIARSGMQSSFQMFLTGKHKTWVSIFLSTLLFSSTHLHVSFILAVLVFPLGLFWGWLYSRNPTLIGVVVSHILIGCFGLFIVGFPTKGAA